MESTINNESPSETELVTNTPQPPQPPKSLTFTNGVLKRHHNHNHPTVVVYKECLKNHAASLGGHALDGCGEFMPSPTSNPSDPTSLKCAACRCHRNFHRRDSDDQGTRIIDYHHQTRQPTPPQPRPQPPGGGGEENQAPNSASPPPISSTYYPNSSAPHMLLALSTGLSGPSSNNNANDNDNDNDNDNHPTGRIGLMSTINGSGRKRIRTKFSQEQKEKMYWFSERLGWKMQKKDEGIVDEFCNEIGVERRVLKVWMHNNKNTFGKRSLDVHHQSSSNFHHNNHYNNGGGSSADHVTTATNCSSS